jgi:uncharacterized membrane protein YbhN (UPF0104 family)
MTKVEPRKAGSGGQRPSSRRKLLVTLLKFSLTALLLIVLIRAAGWSALEEAVSRTNGLWLLALYGTMLLGMGVHTTRLLAVLRLVGLQLRFWRVLLANALSAFYTLILPGDLLAGVAKWANLSAATGQAALVFSAIIYNRMTLVLSTLICGALAVAGQNPFPDIPLAGLATFLAVGLIGGAVVVLHPRSAPFVDRLTAQVCRVLPNFVGSRIVSLAGSLGHFRAFAVSDHLHIFVLALVSFFVSLAMFVFASRAVGVELPYLTLVWVNALLLIARLIPITISNLGVREGLLIVIMGTYGIEPAQAMAVGLIAFTASIVNALVGASYQVALLTGLAQWRMPAGQSSGALASDPFQRLHKPSARPGK